jgi:hypothetical protein
LEIIDCKFTSSFAIINGGTFMITRGMQLVEKYLQNIYIEKTLIKDSVSL